MKARCYLSKRLFDLNRQTPSMKLTVWTAISFFAYASAYPVMDRQDISTLEAKIGNPNLEKRAMFSRRSEYIARIEANPIKSSVVQGIIGQILCLARTETQLDELTTYIHDKSKKQLLEAMPETDILFLDNENEDDPATSNVNVTSDSYINEGDF